VQKIKKIGDFNMNNLETERIIIKKFSTNDWKDFHELSIDWKAAPGPAFDKWRTTEDAAKESVEFMSQADNFFAIELIATNKVIGLLGLNNLDKMDENKQLDLGHVILSKYQDNDIDKEALAKIVNYIFKKTEVQSIITHNDSNHTEQISPLKSLGFKNINRDNPGELIFLKEEWLENNK
jgi:RimJ/RimL family protein N-acetyltransferase